MPRVFRANKTGQVRLLDNPYQQAFLRARRLKLGDGTRAFKRFCLIAGRRGGKTFIGAIACVEEASVPGTTGWCVAPTYQDLHDYVIPQVLETVPEQWIEHWSEQYFDLTLKNGSKISFRSGDDPERMRGPKMHWAWLDECRKMHKSVWDTLRPALSDFSGAAYFTSSPNGYDWLYHTIYKRAIPGPNQVPGYWSCRYKTEDNPAIPREEIEEARATMDPLWFRQEYEAEFVSFEGAIYGDRVDGCLLRDRDRIAEWLPGFPNYDPTYPVVIGLDPGADHPFGAVKLVASPKGLVAVGEYSKRYTSIAEHAAEVRKLSWGHQDVRYGIDRSAIQVQIELSQHGILATQADPSVWAGIQRVQSWMRAGQFAVVEALCPNLVNELRSYRWKDTTNSKTGEKGLERPFKFDDDLVDALRYAVMTWPYLPDVPRPQVGRQAEDVPEEARWAWQREQRLMADPDQEWHSWDKAPTGDMWEW